MRPFISPLLRWRLFRLANGGRTSRIPRSLMRRQMRAFQRRMGDPFVDLPEREFIKTYRLTKNAVKLLIHEITPYMPTQQRRSGISTKLKVLIALNFYATGSHQTIVGQSSNHNVSQTTVSRSVRQVTKALNHNGIFSKYIKWPMTTEEKNVIKAKFYKFRIPGVLGVIDGTHVALLRPILHEERYFNRKGYHSLNVMIICDSELNILCVDPSTPGSAHDSRIWQCHPLSQHLQSLSNRGEHVFLLGDSGYPLRPTMMTPILNTVPGTANHHYYNLHITARNTVERCIGVLKARFRCLLASRALHYEPIMAGKIVNACCILHNIANQCDSPVIPLTDEEAADERQRQLEIDEVRPENPRVNPELQRGRAFQQALVEKLWRNRNQ